MWICDSGSWQWPSLVCYWLVFTCFLRYVHEVNRSITTWSSYLWTFQETVQFAYSKTVAVSVEAHFYLARFLSFLLLLDVIWVKTPARSELICTARSSYLYLTCLFKIYSELRRWIFSDSLWCSQILPRLCLMNSNWSEFSSSFPVTSAACPKL